jgi:hypothetical protein
MQAGLRSLGCAEQPRAQFVISINHARQGVYRRRRALDADGATGGGQPGATRFSEDDFLIPVDVSLPARELRWRTRLKSDIRRLFKSERDHGSTLVARRAGT